MSKNKSKSKYYMTAALCALIAVSTCAASVMAGCGCDRTESTSASVSTDATDASGNPVTSSGEDASNASDGSGSASDADSSNTSGNSGSAGVSGDTDSTKTTGSPNNATHSSTKICTVDGTDYYVGDTVTSVYSLTSPETLVNFQAYITYSNKYLKVTSAELKNSATSSSIINYANLENEICFNGSNITKGYDYTKTKEFVVITYEVIAEGKTSTKFNWQVARGLETQAQFVNNGIPNAGLVVSQELL